MSFFSLVLPAMNTSCSCHQHLFSSPGIRLSLTPSPSPGVEHAICAQEMSTFRSPVYGDRFRGRHTMPHRSVTGPRLSLIQRRHFLTGLKEEKCRMETIEAILLSQGRDEANMETVELRHKESIRSGYILGASGSSYSWSFVYIGQEVSSWLSQHELFSVAYKISEKNRILNRFANWVLSSFSLTLASSGSQQHWELCSMSPVHLGSRAMFYFALSRSQHLTLWRTWQTSICYFSKFTSN